MGEILYAQMEPTNIMDKYAVCVKKDETVVGHLKKGTSDRFAKTIFFFLRCDMTGSCCVKITGRAVNLGDKKGQKVPCKVEIVGQEQYVNILERTLYSLL